MNHPDTDTLRAFREHRLSGAAAAEVALHVGKCARCAKVETPAGRLALQALVSADDHLSDDELDALVDGRVLHPSYRMISLHEAICGMCRAEVEDLRRFAVAGRPAKRWWLAAAAIAFTLLALSAIALFLRRDTAPVIATNPPATATVAAPAPRVVASLADGSGKIELLEDGSVTGVAPRDAEDARAVLSGHAIAIPTFIAAMPGAVRGADAGEHPLRAIEPFRSAVLDARPQFSWTRVRDARGYRVAVFDADYEEVARSEKLDGTSWTPSKPLPAGADLSWHVIADTAAGEISSAGSNRAEAVFRVLTPREASEVRSHESDSHLLRGLLYSRHGLLHDAERELRELARQNPDSPVARALLESISR